MSDELVDVGFEECSISDPAQQVASYETLTAVSNIQPLDDGGTVEVSTVPEESKRIMSNQVYVVRGNTTAHFVALPNAIRGVSGGTPIRTVGPQYMRPSSSNQNLTSPMRVVEISADSSVKIVGQNPRVNSPSTFHKKIEPAGPVTPSLPAPQIQRKKTNALSLGSRKPCNCTRSYCLKLYCECFANGEFCRDCNCTNCNNNLENETERSKAIRTCLDRNPNAFQPKIGVGARGRTDVERIHTKGCHCKKSSCLKNYCECYEAKIACTDKCRCNQCRNTEGDRAAKSIHKMSVQAANAARNNLNRNAGMGPGVGQGQGAGSSMGDYMDRADSPLSDTPTPITKIDYRRMPWFYMTDEVLEATALCLVAQADEMHRQKLNEVEMERNILKEFGRCLHQIINNAQAATPTVTSDFFD